MEPSLCRHVPGGSETCHQTGFGNGIGNGVETESGTESRTNRERIRERNRERIGNGFANGVGNEIENGSGRESGTESRTESGTKSRTDRERIRERNRGRNRERIGNGNANEIGIDRATRTGTRGSAPFVSPSPSLRHPGERRGPPTTTPRTVANPPLVGTGAADAGSVTRCCAWSSTPPKDSARPHAASSPGITRSPARREEKCHVHKRGGSAGFALRWQESAESWEVAPGFRRDDGWGRITRTITTAGCVARTTREFVGFAL
jgi:hypothetical protein